MEDFSQPQIVYILLLVCPAPGRCLHSDEVN